MTDKIKISKLAKQATISQQDTEPLEAVEGEFWLDTSDNAFQGTVFQKINEQLADIGNKTKYIQLACIIRQDPATGIWSILDDAGHSPLNVISVEQYDDRVRVNYSFTANKIKSFIAVPDDVLNKTGFVFGGDVGLSYANIAIAKPSPISGYIASGIDGFTILDNVGINTVTYTGGILRIEHEKSLNALSPVISVPHDYNSKYGLIPVNLSQDFSEFKLVRIKDETSAIFTVSANAFSALAGSDEGYIVNSWTEGILTLDTPSVDGWDIKLTGKDNIIPTLYSVANNQVMIKFYDVVANSQLTTLPDTYFFTITRSDSGTIPNTVGNGELKFYFQRESLSSGKKIDASTPMPVGNNIWVYGLFE